MTARETALQLLSVFERNKIRLDTLFEEKHLIQNLSSKERKFVWNLVSGVIRFRLLLDWKAASLFKGNYKESLNNFKLILSLALYELDYLDFIPPHATLNEYVEIAKKKLPAANVRTVNGILRTYLRIGKSLKPEKKFKYPETRLSVKYSYPEWLIKRWLSFWEPDFVEDLCRAMNERPVFDLRLNKRKIEAAAFEKELIKARIDFTISTVFANVYRITDIQKLQQTGLFMNGICSVQDESGHLAAIMLKDDASDQVKSVLDLCAAPGSKFSALLEEDPDLRLFGLDLRFHRLLKVRENCRRLGLRDAGLMVADGTCAPFRSGVFDKILLDAPCSGLGTIQKHPDIKWRRRYEEIFNFQRLQGQLMAEADRLLKPGGQLVYTTCTIDPAENEEVITQFLENRPDRYRLLSPPVSLTGFISDRYFLRTFPHKHGMEGSFAAKLEKIE